jgi:hypothetical protein
MIIYLSKSSRSDKKYMVEVDGKIVHFGASGYSDYPTHKDSERKQRYITRHKARENWAKSGMKSAGFWSRWLLWGEPTISGSIKEIERKFNVTIRRRA